MVDKGTKLETIYDRIETVKTRFEVLKRDAKIDFLLKKLECLETGNAEGVVNAESDYQERIDQIIKDIEFIETCNVGGEFMQKEDQARVATIAKYQWNMNDSTLPFLDEKEVENLQIAKGTLLPEERQVIQDHITITIDMLEKLPYPKNLRNIPEFAGGHHEKLDGTGYPKGLTANEMSIQAKIMAIADIYEALTAADRPYKDGKKLSKAMQIMHFMKKDAEIDPDLFEIFVKEKVYQKYADKYLGFNQLDEVDEVALLA